jgi:hypothetical protein
MPRAVYEDELRVWIPCFDGPACPDLLIAMFLEEWISFATDTTRQSPVPIKAKMTHVAINEAR